MPGNPLTDPNWAGDLTRTVDKYVGTVRRNATDRAAKLARLVAFGSVLMVTAVAALALLSIILVRGAQRFLVQGIFGLEVGRAVWITYAVTGALFVTIGLLVLRGRHSEPTK
jgi:hypothetical protein